MNWNPGIRGVLARRRIFESGRIRAALLVPPPALVDFEGVQEDDDRPAWVVVGDIGRGFTFEGLNGDGLVLDAGPFVVALEYATGKDAELVGKPSRAFFALALADLGLPPRDVLVVGDNLEADCAGGAAAGCRTALVLTGRSGQFDVQASGMRPDLVVESAGALFGG